MNRTLEDAKEYIIKLSKEGGLNDCTILQLLENIKTDENGLVPEAELNGIYSTIVFLTSERRQTLSAIQRTREDRKKRKDAE